MNIDILNTVILALITIAVIYLGILVKSTKNNKPHNPNSKVELAVIGVKLDEISKKLDNVIEKIDDMRAGK